MHDQVRKELSPSGRFYRMRDQWIRYVIRLPRDEMSATDKMVAVLIAQTINPTTRKWVISQAAVARELEVTERAVKGAVRKLRERGLIEIERVAINGQSKLFNCYELVSPEHAIPEPQGNLRSPA